MIRTLPAGLIDNRIEFFNDPVNLEVSYCLTEGKVTRVRDASARVRTIIQRDMDKHPGKVLALYNLGYSSLEQQMEKYVSCCFGAFDGEADATDGVLHHTEYWPCPKRGSCPAAGVLCSPLVLAYGTLSTRETEVFQRVAMLDKEIADELKISEETVKIHLRRIRQKSGLDNKKELIKLAYQKNLI
ncbi:helix-turn-helix transcriptional regulator [Mucilaginibacter sp. Bleaf8]|uniref:response regulator transcription factor n=1 Tax=Mucilaginibacter sp. Bleaf8 TaxID=2834430 RepID=UPI001BCFB097|nr:helix-turn-helix transcriptional regulator [Mucilaginibacter sp. Bleaf8]MBS7565131.1 helix-turn-helix transcriptional regulator [Mucilaginibacter sp. Bleaf8]